MEITLYISVVLLSLAAGYFFGKRILFSKTSSVIVSATIDTIHISKVGGIWSPEVLVKYYFYYENQKFSGSGYVRIDRFTEESDLLLSDRNGFPVLVTSDNELVGEEHIEMYLLECRRGIPVEISPATLPASRIQLAEKKKETLFQDVSIDFPWMKD